MIMDNDQQKRCLIKLVQNLRNNKENNRKSVTVLLGAGCSLTSSNKNITTNGIIHDLVLQHTCEGEEVPSVWTNLYEKFVNNVWYGQGSADKSNLLENYFKDMNPSDGYRQLRILVEENYINNIITTNFDPMLDTVFEGLSYNLQVGTKTMIIGDNPQFTLLKAHGDLKYGELRFSPAELYKLPESIESAIKALTDAILIIVGYRGQDMGIIQALNDSDDHCAYWVTYDKPDYFNDYENGPLIIFLKKRNSDNNLLFGPEYGDFDSFISKITSMLQDKSSLQSQSNQLYKLWEKSFINDFLCLNIRFKNLFINMLNILEHMINELSWSSYSLYYADSHNKLLSSIIQIFNSKVFPAEDIYCISNEVDSLLFALSIEIWCLCQGYPVTNIDLVKVLKENYSKIQESLDINQDFWDALSWLSNISISDNLSAAKAYYDIVISLDKGKNFQMILKKVSINEFASIFLLLQRILIFTKTSGQGNDVIGINYKKLLESYLFQIVSNNRHIDIQLRQIPLISYQEIYDNVLCRYFSEQAIRDRRILFFEKLYVQIDVVESKSIAALGIIDEFLLKSEKMKASFIGNIDGITFVHDESIEVIKTFLNSESNGLFITGDSGTGKTSIIKKIIFDYITEEFIILPMSVKQITQGTNILAYILDDEFIKPDIIRQINAMMELHHQKLILIIDGINELDAPLQQILSEYKYILEFCDFLSKENLNNIRIIITCRTEFYYQIKVSSQNFPSPSSFFSKVNNYGEASTIYQLPPLTDKDIEKIVNSYSFSGDIYIDNLKEKFGKIIYNPLFLNIICKMQSKEISDQSDFDEISLYESWFKNIQNSAVAQQISTNGLMLIIDYAIYDKYFSTSEDMLTTSKLFMCLPEKEKRASEYFEWLVEHDIFQKTQNCHNLILFEHDKIEEFFFIQYIRNKYALNLIQAFSDLKIEQQNSPIVKDSYFALLNILKSTNLDMFKNCIISIIHNNDEWLIQLTARFLIEGGKYIYDILKLTEQYISLSDLEEFVSLLLAQMNQKISNIEEFSFDAIKCMNDYIHHSTLINNPLILATNYYNYAKYIWIFPLNESEATYDFAIELCYKIDKFEPNYLPQKLIDNNHQLLAILLRNKGELNEAVSLTEKVYNKLFENACFDDACQALLDLGAMYRELTWFDQALKRYQAYPVELVTDLSLKYRLYMNIGIIYKNKVQNDLFNKNVTKELTYKNYYKAQELFEQVYDFAQEINHIPLLLEIIAELIESTVTGYYLNVTTISTAVTYAEKMDVLLPKYPVPVRRIQSCRMWARVLTLQGKPLDAIERLREGFQIACCYNIPFRAADCCNQISGILCDNLNSNYISREMLMEGIEACQYSIDYYAKLQQNEHTYLLDSRKKLEILQNALKNMC